MAREREQIVVAIAQALESPAEVLAIFADSPDPESAQIVLCERWQLQPVQARAIADMQFRRVSRDGRQRVADELAEVRRHISSLE